MGFMKGVRDLKDISDMSRQYERPKLGDALAMSKDALQEIQTMQRLGISGVPGRARLLSVTDTGGTMNEHPICEIQLEVTVPGHAPYTTVVRQPVPRMQAPMLQPGGTIAVKVDPNDPTTVALDWEAQGAGSAGLVAQMQAAGQASAAAAQQSQDPVARLERLQALRDKGLLTDSEFDAQRARILESI